MKLLSKCDCCRKDKEDTKLKQMLKSVKNICPTCEEELKLTTKCMQVSVDSLIKKRPKEYYKVNKLTVAQIGSENL